MFTHFTTFKPVDADSHKEHKGVYSTLVNKETARQLRVCTGEFISWVGGVENPTLPSEDLAEMAWTCSIVGNCLDDKVWSRTFSDPAGLERVVSVSFKKVDKRVYTSKAEFLNALSSASDKLDEKERVAATMTAVDVKDCYPARNFAGSGLRAEPESWEGQTYKELRNQGKGTTIAFLESFTTGGERVYMESRRTLRRALLVAQKLGYSDPNDTGDAKRHQVSRCLEEQLVLGPAYYEYHPPGKERIAYFEMYVNLVSGGGVGDGSSALSKRSTRGLVVVHAPVIHRVLHDLPGTQSFNDALIDIAHAVFNDTSMCDPKRLFTVFGMRALQRAVTLYNDWATSGDTQALVAPERFEAFMALVEKSRGPLGGMGTLGYVASSGGGGGGGGGGGANPLQSREGLRVALGRARLQHDTPAIIDDAISELERPGHDPLDVLQLLFTGKTSAAPGRAASSLTVMIAWNTVQGTLLDARLAPVAMYSHHNGGRYLGRAIGTRLVKAGLCLADDVATLEFDRAFEILRGKSWGSSFDAYNLLILPLVQQVQCAGTLGETKVEPYAAEYVYKDILLNLRLPKLVSWAFEAVAIPHQGPDSFRAVLDNANAFALFNGGVTGASTKLIMTAIATLLRGILSEGYQHHAPHRDVANLDAKLNDHFLRGADTEGARGVFKKFIASMLRAAHERRERTFSETMPTQIAAPGLSAFSLTTKRAANPDTRPTKQPRLDESGGGGGGDDDDDTAAAEARKLAAEKEANRKRDFADAKSYFRKNAEEWCIVPKEGKMVVYDAKAAAEEYGPDVCLPFLFARGLPNAPSCCPKPGDPNHAEGGKCHTIPEGKRGVGAFNLSKKGAGKGAGKGNGAGKGKGAGKPKPKPKK